MVDRHRRCRVSGAVRVLGLLVLLGGVAAMHIGVLWSQPGSHRIQAGTAVTVTRMADHHPADGLVPVNDHDGVGHEAMHMCVFILSAAALTIGLMLLYRLIGTGTDDSGVPIASHWRVNHERPPPWTVPSLAELSILRI
ncbi:hypothetical protein IU459_15805 [Nocardia amamiensis]|uniref:DUF2946 domain-containing protein n=1 Tax=Nocardia amamiensis TaxID=404578 RepID=A0ABS0CT10_9NOCA|nr:DUF6153 family protein [Nocardia amamiensis]MBF6298998.1 hypothetical protein [Nocardia amamiensis]